MTAPAFRRYIGIDYSGAKTPDSGLTGIRVYMADRNSLPKEILPPPGPSRYWTRRGLAWWLAERLMENVPSIAGIDHGFSFPGRYFQDQQLNPDWPSFLDDFHRHWPTDTEHTTVQCIRDGVTGNGEARSGSARWRRIAEERAGAKSVFHFDVPGSVAKSTHAGLPWLLFLRQRLGERVRFWPFDGWEVPKGFSVLAEVYPSLWRNAFPLKNSTPDQQDAYAAAAWLQRGDLHGTLHPALSPSLSPEESRIAGIEGWILGVP